MDNITHSLIGVVLARTALPKKLNATQLRARVWTAVLASNLPDLDSLVTPLLREGKLGYLLHHRGYTHTLFFAIPLGLLSALLGAKIANLKSPPKKDLFTLGILGIFFHVIFDFFNDYGVHPFSPFWNHWIYGDTLFIVEPLLWMTLLPYAFFSTQNRISRGALSLIGSLLLIALWSLQFTSWPVATVATLWGLTFVLICKKNPSPRPAHIGVALTLALFMMGSFFAKKITRKILETSGAQIAQLSATPAPANPLCWSLMSLSIENQKDYVARAGIVSLIPHWLRPETCHLRNFHHESISLTRVTLNTPPTLYWIGEFRRPLPEFLQLQDNWCLFRNYLKFARIPIWSQGSQSWMASDLRYTHFERESFASIWIRNEKSCHLEQVVWRSPTSVQKP